jgi:hypothetical protein
MKDRNKRDIESGRPAKDALDCVNACLDALYSDRRKNSGDRFAQNMTYEELLGTLLLARDEIETSRAARAQEDDD